MLPPHFVLPPSKNKNCTGRQDNQQTPECKLQPSHTLQQESHPWHTIGQKQAQRDHTATNACSGLTRTKNAHKIYIGHAYKVSLQSSPFHNQPLQLSELIMPLPIKWNDCTSSSFFFQPVTLNEGQGHSNWYQNVAFSHVYLQTEFERISS